MRPTKLDVVATNAFRKDYKLAIKRGLDIRLLAGTTKSHDDPRYCKSSWLLSFGSRLEALSSRLFKVPRLQIRNLLSGWRISGRFPGRVLFL